MSNETQHTPADHPGGEMSERTMEKARQVVHRLSEWYFAEGGDNDPDSPIDREDLDALHELVRTAEATLRTPRGEVEAQPWRKVGEEPPPNGVQVLAYDPRPDGYSYAGCWAYTLIRKGDQYYLDGERCDEEDRSRLQIEEWLWQPLPPYPGSRSKDAALRSDAQGEAMDADAMWYHWSSGHEVAALQGLRTASDDEAHRFLNMLADWQRCPKPSDHDAIAALRPEAQGEDRWEDLVFGPITEAYNEAHAAHPTDRSESDGEE